MTVINNASQKTIYLISALIFLAGLALFLLFVSSSYQNLGKELINLNLSEKKIVSFEKPGKYALFEENKAESEKQENEGAIINKYLITIRDINSRSPIALEIPSAKDRYTYKGRKGIKIYEYQITDIGDYEFFADLIDQKYKDDAALIIDKGFSNKRSENVVKAQALLLFPTVLALVLLIYGYLKK